MQRGVGLWLAVLATVALLHGLPVQAQSSTGSSSSSAGGADQMELLRSLPPDQREAIMRQLGIGQGASDLRRGSRQGRDAENDERTGDRTPDDLEPDDELSMLMAPRLKGEDTILIRIDFDLPEKIVDPLLAQQAAQAQQAAAQAAAATAAQAAATPQVQAAEEQRKRREEAEKFEPGEKERLQELIDLIRSRNPYKLDRNGFLFLPGFASGGIALAGLNEELATLRLQADPAFQKLEIEVILLPLKRTGPEGLKPFGYDLFNAPPSTFAPVTEVPVPADYIVGPGDELDVQLWGNQNRSFTLRVSRDGRINFPGLGPLDVAGRTFTGVRQDIESRVANRMVGVRVAVSMGDTGSMRVFVLGEARRPGTYTVSGLATMTAALFASGGVKPVGSLRNIQLKRQGAVVRELDLYDLLIRGDTRDDAKLQAGDVIFIPPLGPTVAVDGEVRRPAIYELRGPTDVAGVIGIAGGLTPEADLRRASLARIDEQRRRVVVGIDMVEPQARGQPVQNGDMLRVTRLRPQYDTGVTLQGYVFRSGPYAWREGMRLTDVLGSVDELRPDADIHYILIRRETMPNRDISVVSADLAEALRAPGTAADPVLMPRDEITVFDLSTSRERVVKPLLDQLRLQARVDRPTPIVQIDGKVKAPGEYPLETGMTVGDLIRAGGSLDAAAYGGKAELTRYRVVEGESRRTELINVDLAAVLRGDPGADVPLQAFDYLTIKEIPDWGIEEKVTLKGEVRFPGVYAIKRGETLSSVVERAGGLTSYAFAEGSVFTREELKEREQEQLDILQRRLQNDLTALALQGAAANQAQAGTALTVGQALLSQLEAAQAVGRLVIDLDRTLKSEQGSALDVIMRDGDNLVVPRLRQEVTVIGEVQNATSHLYRRELGRDDYVSLSGGATRKADRGRVYMVRADGSVVSGEGSRWFRRGGNVQVRQGDTIVVPLDTERLPALPLWTSVTQIIYNLAISAAAVNSF